MTPVNAHGRAALAALVVAILFAACGGSGGNNCDRGHSAAFAAIVNTAPTLPERFRSCGVKAKKTSLINVLESTKMTLDIIANDSVGIDSTYFEFWTKNTTYTTNGSARGDTLQQSGPWVLTNDNYVVNYRSYDDFEILVDVNIGWPIASGVREKDSIHVKYRTPTSFPDATYGQYNGVWWKWFKVKNGSTTPYIQQPSVIQSGNNASWEVVPADDTGGYRIDWYWNSALETSFQDKYVFTKAMPVAGLYPLRVDIKLFDTTFVFNYTIDVPITVTLTGSASVSNSVTNYYSASAAGGTPAYTYQWYIDGSPYTTSTSFAAPYWALYSDHHLEVFATDANSVVGYADLWVFVSSCDPEDENCQIELRANPKPPDRTGVRRPVTRTPTPTVRRP